MTEHERQHAIVADRKAAYDAISGKESHHSAKMQAGKRAWWALTWHMRRSHREALRSRSPFLGMTYAEVEAWHEQLHADLLSSR
jgi:hypothetical protein